jgi:hypothetical protein
MSGTGTDWLRAGRRSGGELGRHGDAVKHPQDDESCSSPPATSASPQPDAPGCRLSLSADRDRNARKAVLAAARAPAASLQEKSPTGSRRCRCQSCAGVAAECESTVTR